MRRPVAAALALALMLAGCAPTVPFPTLPRLTVTTQFGVDNLCDAGLSPQIRLSGVPDGTTDYTVQITDIEVLIQKPWRETVPLSSKSEIPEGAAKSYDGPCLGDMTRFPPTTPYGYLHRVEVLALGADGQPLAYGSTVVWVESPYITAKRARLRQQQPGSTVTQPPPPSLYPSTPFGLPGNFPGTGVAPQTMGVLQ